MTPVCKEAVTRHSQSSSTVRPVAIGLLRMTVCFAVFSFIFAQHAVAQVADSSQAREARIRNSIIAAGNNVSNLQSRIVSAREKLDELAKKVEEIKPRPPAEEEPDEKTGVQELQLRPPLQGETPKRFKLFVCVDRKLFLADYPAIDTAYKKEVEGPAAKTLMNGTAKTVGKMEGTAEVTSGDYVLKYSAIYVDLIVKHAWIFSSQIIRRPRAEGETIDEIAMGTSQYQRELSRTNRNGAILLLAVYPDSADIFREARRIATEEPNPFLVRPIFIPAGKVLEYTPSEIPSEFYLSSP